jgi:hypothetical protein
MTKELIDRIFKEPGIKYELSEFETFGKPIQTSSRKPPNYEKPLGSKGNSNLEDYLIPVIKLMWNGHDHKEAFRIINEKINGIEAFQQEIKAREKATRDALAKAAAIDAAVFDMKAVNPNAGARTDTRTPAEIIAGIEAQGEIVSAALSNLKNC